MNLFFKMLLCSCLCFHTVSAIAQEGQLQDSQENIRSFRIGAKLGVPNLLSGNVEYILPLLNKKFGISVDYSELNMNSEDLGFETQEDAEILEQHFKYIEGGIHYYIFKPGRGVYTGLSYARYSLEGTVPEYSENEDGTMGDGYIDVAYNSINLKLGAKWGGFFYFKPEVGYAFNPLPSSIPITVNFEDGSSENQELDLTADSKFLNAILKGLIFNIGVGISF